MTVYFNGEYIPKDDVHISPDDRGFLFGDGVYEVVRLYNGRLFQAYEHFARMYDSLRKISIAAKKIEALADIAARLLADNSPPPNDFKLYVQVTRGVAPRAHRFPPADTTPTVYASVSALHADPTELEEGIAAITVGDQRWARCDIKSIALLPNVLAHQRALDSAAKEAIFIKDGMVTEGTHNSVFGVFGKTVATAPLTNAILPSITRKVVIEVCSELLIPVVEFPMTELEMRNADEVFVAGTASEVTPVVRIDGNPVAGGSPGSTTRRIQEGFMRRVKQGFREAE